MITAQETAQAALDARRALEAVRAIALADRHGFVLQAESAVGAGATFTVIAPAVC